MEIISLSKNIELHTSLDTIVINKSEDSRSVKIENQLTKLLVLLFNRKGQLITKEEFIEEVWDGNQLVGEKALTKNIFKLRKLLKEIDPESNIQIETVPKKGYLLTIKEPKKTNTEIRKPVLIFVLLLAIFFAAMAILKEPFQNKTNNKVEVLEYDETNTDTIIFLDQNNKLKVVNLDSLNGKVLKLD